MADNTGEPDNPVGLGIGGIDVPLATQPAPSGGQGEADGLVGEEDVNRPGQYNAPLEVLTHPSLPLEGNDDSPPKSAFSISSNETDEDADDEGVEEGDDEVDYAADRECRATNSATAQPQVQPFPAVIGFTEDDEIYRPNIWEPEFPLKYHSGSDSDPEERKKLRAMKRKVRSHAVARPSPLRTASSPDSPVSPKKRKLTGGFGVLPEPSPEPRDEGALSSLSDSGLTPRIQTPVPPLLKKYTTGYDWSEEDEEDTQWYEEAIGTPTGPRRASKTSLDETTAYQTHADEGDGSLSDQQLPDSGNPTGPMSDAGNETAAYGPDEGDGKFHHEDSEYDMQQQTATAPESFDPVFVGANEHVYPSEEESPGYSGPFSPASNEAEQHANSNNQTSPTSPLFDGPEPLTGLTPQEGIDAFWAWRERTRPAPRTFRTDRNRENQDKSGDLTPTSERRDISEVQEYLSAQRLTVKQQLNVQNMAKASRSLSEAIEFDLESTQEYLKLRMLKYRAERNNCYHRAVESEQRVGRRERQIDDLDAKLLETERAYVKVLADKENMEPVLRELKEERKQLRAQFLEQSQMSEAYQKAAQRSGDDLRNLRAKQAKRAASLQLSSIMEIASQEPVSDLGERHVSDTNEKPKQARQAKRAAPLQFSSIAEVFSQEPVPDATPAKRNKQAAPLGLSSITEIFSQESVSLESERPVSDTNKQLLSRAPVSDTNQSPKSAPPSYRPRRSPPWPMSPDSPSHPRTRRPAPEQEANWSLADRPRLVDFMTEWINDHRESTRDSATNPLQKAQLDNILGVGFLSWDRLIEKLRLQGYIIRPDHLAQALADPVNIQKHRLPQPNTAVYYAAQRLTKQNAVKTLIEKILMLEREARDTEVLPGTLKDLTEAKATAEALQGLLNDLEDERGSLLRRNRLLQKELAKKSGSDDLEDRLALKAELEETRQTLDEALSAVISPKPRGPWDTDFPTLMEEKLALAWNKCQQLSERVEGLKEKLNACNEHGKVLKSEIEESAQKLSDSEAKFTEMEAKLAAADNNQTGDAKSPSTTEAELAECHEHGLQLKREKEDLAKKLRECQDELKAKLAAHDNDQGGDDEAHRKQVEALKKKILELEHQLATSRSQTEQLQTGEKELKKQLAASRSQIEKLQSRIEELELELEVQAMQQQGNAGSSSDASDRLKDAEQHAADLQAKVDELQLQLDNAKKKVPQVSVKFEKKRLAEIKESKAHRASLEVSLIAKCEEENANLHQALEAAQKDIQALQEKIKSQQESLSTDEPASASPDPAVNKPEEGEDMVTLRRELAEAREKNEQLEQAKTSLKNDLEVAQEDLSILREQVKPKSHEGSAPASERGLDSPSRGVENGDALGHGAGVKSDSAGGSVADLEGFVAAQSSGESEEISKDDDEDESGLDVEDVFSPTTMDSVKRARDREPGFERPDVHPAVDDDVRSYPSVTGEVIDMYSPLEPTSASGQETLPVSQSQNSPAVRPEALDANSTVESDSEENDKKRADELAKANDWLQQDNEDAWKKVEAMEEELKELRSSKSKSSTGLKQPLPATRQLVPLPTEPSVVSETLSAARMARRAEMQRSPAWVADTQRRRLRREQHFAQQRQRVMLICQRAAAVFGEEYLPYVPVKERFKPMGRAW